MFADLAPLLNTLPPSTQRALQQAINACGRQLNRPPDRVQRWVSFTIVADALTKRTRDGEMMFHLKGGAAIELRLGQAGSRTPRVSKDLDATYHDQSAFGLTAAAAFPCIPLRKQIAQKLHAVTEIPDSGEPNQR
jgi:hypothetical protein